ncbi:hypothetical protein NESM_000551200 [Novymonas esmeraldas]|uniref:Uncharacterized protein n=1 Tax=Novymonas esmeraldas TaxID=1808958 RepID=A0AAW0ERN3_9TRYP
MARVLVNNEDCTVEMKGDFIAIVYAAVVKEPLLIGVRSVTQLLRSRKDDTAAKLVADGASYVLKFGSLRDREILIECIVHLQEAEQAPSNEDWVATAICHAAVDVGVLDEEELKSIMRAAGQRGVEQAFDALETLVDPETFQLRPITEQMENDVLRQIPVLAAIFQQRVVDRETKKTFWEAVVRKYFCFSRTFLEEDIQRLEGAKPATTEAAALPQPPSTSVDSSLAVINASSLGALPKSTAVVVDTDVNEEDLLHLEDEEDEEARRSFQGLFAAHRHVPMCRVPALPIGGAVLPFPRVAADPAPPPPPPTPSRQLRFVGRDVLHQFPAEPIEKTTLEALRLFWRSGARQRKALLDKHTGTRKSRGGFLQRMCLEQAERTLQDT